MIYYKNTSSRKLTFHGVEFGPREIKPVPDFINTLCMVRCDKPSEPVRRIDHVKQEKKAQSTPAIKVNNEQGGITDGSD